MPQHTFTLGAPRRGERGIGLVLMAILAVLLLGIIGLAVDAGHVQTTAQQLQAAADAAALAGANQVFAEWQAGDSAFPLTRAKARDVALANAAAAVDVQLDPNPSNAAEGDIVVGWWSKATKAFTPTTDEVNAVRVVARRSSGSASGPLMLVFGGLFGSGQGEVARSAIATFAFTPNPLIHVLDPADDGALSLSGNVVLDVGDGVIQVNSTDACAVDMNGSPVLSAAETMVVGGACSGSGSINGALSPNAPSEPDPLADILPGVAEWDALKASLPKPAGAKGKIAKGGSFKPGYYPGGLALNNSMSVTLQPGTYMFGSGASMVGSATLTGDGVTLLFDAGAKLNVGGGASMDLTPPTSGEFQGLTMMFHRDTTAADACSIGGNGDISIEGTLYCPSGGVELKGTGDAQAIGQIVCDHLALSGNAQITGAGIVPPDESGNVYLVR